MIIVRVPLRISFVGGGSDLPAFYNQSTGRVISAAIDKYVFVAINEKFDGKFRIGYSVTELVDKPHEVKNTRVRAAFEHFGVDRGLEVVSIADVPSSGSGLGASSSFSVALMHGLGEFLGKPHKDKYAVAEDACRLEMEMLGEKIGKQDQYAAAFGGVNVMEFMPTGVTVKPVRLSKKHLTEFHSHLALFHVGGIRSAADYSSTLAGNLAGDKEKFLAQKEMADAVIPFKSSLMKGDYRALGRMLSESWELKKKTSSGISTAAIDGIYATGMENGAWGGKLLGAGGGGFMLFIVSPRNRKKLCTALSHIREVPFGFDVEGSKVVFSRFKGVV